MAKKKKTTKKKTTHKKKMGAINHSPMERTAWLLTGGLAGALVKRTGDYLLTKQTVVTDPKKVELLNDLAMVGEIGLGITTAIIGKHPFVQGAGLGMFVDAGVSGLKRIGLPIAGIGEANRRLLDFPVRKELLNGINPDNRVAVGESVMRDQIGSSQLGGMNKAKRMQAGAM